MHYNNFAKREELIAKMPWLFDDSKSKVLSFINLCIYPYKFELLFDSIRTQGRISKENYNACKGVVAGMLVLVKRQHRESEISIDNYTIDFIKFIKADQVGDPIKFLLSMKVYFHRFLFIVGLQVAFGVDWREFVYTILDLKQKPQAKSYHTLFTNKHLRTLLQAYVVWKNYREIHDEDYQLGVNDLLTLLDKAATMKTNLGREVTQELFEGLQATLPSWDLSTRRKAAWAIDTAQDGFSMVNRQFSEWRYKQVQG